MQNRLNTIKGARGGRERDGRTEMIVDVGRRTHHSEGKWGAWRTFSRGGSNALMKSQGRAIHGTGRGAEGHGKKKKKKIHTDLYGRWNHHTLVAGNMERQSQSSAGAIVSFTC